MADIIDIEILEDGTISVKTSKVSQANHYSAEEFLNELEVLTGSKRKTTKLKPNHAHVHAHGHVSHSH